jgi:hypothetical protein
MLIKSETNVTINSIRLRSRDLTVVKVLSNLAESTLLPKNDQDDFSWPASGITVVKNVTESDGTLELKVLKSGAGLVARSSRGTAKILDETFEATIPLRAGEAITLRSLDHETPKGMQGL